MMNEFVVCCSADGNYEVRYKSNVLIYPDGEVLWIPPAIYQVNLSGAIYQVFTFTAIYQLIRRCRLHHSCRWLIVIAIVLIRIVVITILFSSTIIIIILEMTGSPQNSTPRATYKDYHHLHRNHHNLHHHHCHHHDHHHHHHHHHPTHSRSTASHISGFAGEERAPTVLHIPDIKVCHQHHHHIIISSFVIILCHHHTITCNTLLFLNP